MYCVLPFALIFLLIERASALECYDCTSAAIASCADPFYSNIGSIDCSNSQYCVKQITYPVLTAPAHTVRGCVNRDYCEIMAEVSELCELCSTDHCNSSLAISPTIVLITLMFLTMYTLS